MPVWQGGVPPDDDERKVFPVEAFGGLDLRRDPQEVGWSGAVDLLNVDFDRSGRVRSRDRFVDIANITADTEIQSAIWYGEDAFALAGTNGVNVYLDTFSQGGAAIDSESWAATGTPTATHMVQFGTPTSTLLFIAALGTTLRKYDGTNDAASVGKPRFIAVTPQSNRLVQARFSAAADSPTGSNGSDSTVFFSDAGAPETFSANNFVHLTPGDGEAIRAVAVYDNILFVFKRSRMFLFYGEGTDGTGEPVFEYRTVSLPLGGPSSAGVATATAGQQRTAVGPDGVYFLNEHGLFRTAGGSPERVGLEVDALLRSDVAVSMPYVTATGAISRIAWVGDRLFCTSVAGSYSLVWNHSLRAWTIWADTEDEGNHGGPWFGIDDLIHYVSNGSSDVHRLDPTATFAGESYYRLGFSDLGNPMTEKILRELLLDGIGSPTVKVAVNDGSLDSGTAVTLGTSPAVANGRHRKSYRGRNFSVQIGKTNAAWQVNRMVGHVLGERPPGLRSAA